MSVELEERAKALCDGTIVLVARERVRQEDLEKLRDYISERLGGHRFIVLDHARMACIPADLAEALEMALGEAR